MNIKEKKIILFGAPGSGKGTQAEMLAKDAGLFRVSLGDILRQEVEKATDLGNEVKGYMQQGLLVPDGVVARVIDEYIGSGNFILDGYPRNIAQAHTLNEILSKRNSGIDLLVY